MKWNKEIKSERNKLSNDLKEAEEEVNLIEEKLNRYAGNVISN